MCEVAQADAPQPPLFDTGPRNEASLVFLVLAMADAARSLEDAGTALAGGSGLQGRSADLKDTPVV